MVERFNGIKFNTERLTDQELVNMFSHKLAELERVAGEAERLAELVRERGIIVGTTEAELE